jgi:hypothetical protein
VDTALDTTAEAGWARAMWPQSCSISATATASVTVLQECGVGLGRVGAQPVKWWPSDVAEGLLRGEAPARSESSVGPPLASGGQLDAGEFGDEGALTHGIVLARSTGAHI